MSVKTHTITDPYGDKVEVVLFDSGGATVTAERRDDADGVVSVALTPEDVSGMTEFLTNDKENEVTEQEIQAMRANVEALPHDEAVKEFHFGVGALDHKDERTTLWLALLTERLFKGGFLAVQS
jgi:hypothetical protein